MGDDMEDGLLIRTCDNPYSLHSEYDVVNESGNYSIQSLGDIPVNATDGAVSIGRSHHSQVQQHKRWELNYHEAAVYLQEGENNDKFKTHPRSQVALPAYLMTHNTMFYLLDFTAALVLILLALVEEPAVEPVHIHIGIIASVELLCLLVIGLELCMRLKWLGPRTFTCHIRTMLKVVLLFIMVAETITVLIRQAHHFRVTRALRPLFILDSHYLRDVRRFIRQIIHSMPPILDMLLLLLFFMLIFSILGFYLFFDVPNDVYFQTIQDSFLSLFILLTTANFPDVMLPAYNHSRWSCIFFIVYLSLELYFLMNLLLAVVYDAFSQNEKIKLKKLLLHKREGGRRAFKLLVTKQHPNKVSLKHFAGLMKFYRPKMSRKYIYLTFKSLNITMTGFLSQEEFYKVYDNGALTWKKKKPDSIWSANFIFPFNRMFKGLYWLSTLKWFDYFIYVIIAINFVWTLVDTIIYSVKKSDNSDLVTHFKPTWYTIMFAGIYVVEAIIKILGLGPVKYFRSGWNVFDFLVTLAAVIGILMELVDESFYFILILRPLRLLRLFKVKRRFRDVLGTFVTLFNRMVSLAVVMLLLYYFFAIIGMECFAKFDMRNCCKNTSVEGYYYYDNATGHGGYYYLNDFRNIIVSGVTLFELTVVNNWFIIMEGYASVSSQWSRLYFMLFYIATMVVMTVVVAFILEAFLFRIQYRHKMHVEDIDDDAIYKLDVGLTPHELQMCAHKEMPFTGYFIQQQLIHGMESTFNQGDGGRSVVTWFRGERLLGKNDFSLRMYNEELETMLKKQCETLQDWIQEGEREPEPEELHEMSTSSVLPSVSQEPTSIDAHEMDTASVHTDDDTGIGLHPSDGAAPMYID